MQAIFSVFLLISALGLIISVLLQESDEDGLGGVIGGNSPESLWGKNRSTSKEAILQRTTIISAVVFVISTLVLAAK